MHNANVFVVCLMKLLMNKLIACNENIKWKCFILLFKPVFAFCIKGTCVTLFPRGLASSPSYRHNAIDLGLKLNPIQPKFHTKGNGC